MNFRMSLITSSGLGILLFFLHCASGGGNKPSANDVVGDSVTVVGESPIYQGDQALARTRALKDAKLNAVRKVIGEEISAKSGFADGQSLGSSLFSKTDGFVKSYDILDEKLGKLNTTDFLRLTVRCKVERSQISTAVDQLLQDVGNPRTVVLVSTKINGKPQAPGSSSNIAESQLMELLRKNGSKIVSSAPLSAFLKSNPNFNLDDIEVGSPLLKSAMDTGAEVLIIGSVETKDQPAPMMNGKPMGVMSTAATGPYKIIQLWGDGKIFGSGSVEGRGADITQEVSREVSVKKWAERVAGFANKQIKDEWFKLIENNSIILKFTGLPLEEAIGFKNDLISYTAVKDVNDRTTNLNGSDWELSYPGKESMFAEELLYKKDSGFSYLGKYSMDIVESKRGVVTLRFKNR